MRQNKQWRTEEIIICDTCKGKGYILCEKLTNYHKSDYITWKEDCNDCGGSGRLQKTIITEIVPYKGF